MENARPPHVLDFMAGVYNSERDDDRRAFDRSELPDIQHIVHLRSYM